MKEIKLTQGKVAQVDDEDFEWLNQWKWCTQKKNDGLYYMIRGAKINGKRITIRVHNLIVKPPTGFFVDHKDHNGLNNQKSNLRICTRSQNAANRRKTKKKTSSKYLGVVLINKPYYLAKISIKGKLIYVGISKDEVTAAKKYDKKAKELFGEFATVNFQE